MPSDAYFHLHPAVLRAYASGPNASPAVVARVNGSTIESALRFTYRDRKENRVLLWEEQLTGIEIEPGVYRYEVTLHDYTMKLACIVVDPAVPVRATLKIIDGFYYLSIVDVNGRNLAQFCRKT